MQGVKAGSKIFRGENEGKANYTALILESFNYNCSFKRVISSYSWTVNPCRCAHIMSPSFTVIRRKLGLYLCTRDFSFHTTTELSLKASQWLKGRALPSSPGECGHPQQPGVTRAGRAHTVTAVTGPQWGTANSSCTGKHQKRPLARWKIKITTCLWTIPEYQWNALCVLSVCEIQGGFPPAF